MFSSISSLLILMMCVYLLVFIGCLFLKNKCVRYIACVMALSGVIIYSIDFVAYLNGGIKTEEYVTVSQSEKGNDIGYFTVNDKYWGVGGSFLTHKFVTVTNPKDTEIRIIQTEPCLKETFCTIFYLPVSKFVVRIEIS